MANLAKSKTPIFFGHNWKVSLFIILWSIHAHYLSIYCITDSRADYNGENNEYKNKDFFLKDIFNKLQSYLDIYNCMFMLSGNQVRIIELWI